MELKVRNPISCLFFYKKRLYVKDGAGGFKPALNKDGTFKENANYISFLQVISCFWEVVDEETGKLQLNVFLNGGTLNRDYETREVRMKPGYTVVLPAFLGEAFIDQFYVWSCAFGIPAAPVVPNRDSIREARPRSGGAKRSHSIREEEFAPLDDVDPPAVWESSDLQA